MVSECFLESAYQLLSNGVTIAELHESLSQVRKQLKEEGKLPKPNNNKKGFSEALAKRRIRTINKEIRKFKEQIKRAQDKIAEWKSQIEALRAEKRELRDQIKANASNKKSK